KALNALGANLDADGIYGKKTEEAVARYGAAL
ncbi:MAG: peptidoglycan-binding domain-containing protein, partial [Candidatus Spyradocola sp.]